MACAVHAHVFSGEVAGSVKYKTTSAVQVN